MSLPFACAVFFMLWWIILFAVLPFGLHRTQQEAGEVVPGSEPGAPEKPKLFKVLLVTTLVTTFVFVAYVLLRNSGFSLSDIPFFYPPSTQLSQ